MNSNSTPEHVTPGRTDKSERESTDGSLRAEREKTDLELQLKRAAVERRADDVVESARDHADEVVHSAREQADHSAEVTTEPEAQRVKNARAVEDDALHAERLRSDESVRREREDRKRALASLLRMERDDTDEDLLIERGLSDEALTTRDLVLAMVSHDLKSLLGGIALTAEVLAKDLPADEAGSTSGRSRALMIQRLAARMNGIIGDLVDIASIEAGKLIVQPEQQDANELVREAIEAFKLSAAAREINIGLDVPVQQVPVLVDRDRILQVMSNLISNAIKFTPHGGAFTVRVETRAGSARVSVADSGPGIPTDRLEVIFDRFSQLGRSDRNGLGLGLYISRCIIEGHGGRIWAESVPGAGSTFFFEVPAASKR